MLSSTDTPLLLEKRIKLLESIIIEGSINKAIKKVPISYKAAWEAIESMNNLCPSPVVTKETGGVGGGGTKVTPYGKNLIKTYRSLQIEHKKFLDHLTRMTDFDTGTLKSLQRVNMQLSARNQIRGEIVSIDVGALNCNISIKLKSGNIIVSVITHMAYATLNLKVDDEVVAIFKSSTVMLSSDSNISISARNRLKGRVDKINISDINSEVVIDIGGDIVASIITTDSIKSMDIKKGDHITAIIKSSDVIIGK
jgi:molybdate transport system regulatory protein